MGCVTLSLVRLGYVEIAHLSTFVLVPFCPLVDKIFSPLVCMKCRYVGVGLVDEMSSTPQAISQLLSSGSSSEVLCVKMKTNIQKFEVFLIRLSNLYRYECFKISIVYI